MSELISSSVMFTDGQNWFIKNVHKSTPTAGPYVSYDVAAVEQLFESSVLNPNRITKGITKRSMMKGLIRSEWYSNKMTTAEYNALIKDVEDNLI